MSSKFTSSLLARLLFVSIVLNIAGQAVDATRNIPNIPMNDGQTKHAEWLIGHDSSELIPDHGRGMLPPILEPHNPFCGGIGGSTGGRTPSYIPGGDDTFVPNPGFEVPIPGNGASGASGAAAGTHQHP